MSREATIAQKGPYAVPVEAGREYYWCACGGSRTQPFCDGTHQGTSFQPVAFTPDGSGTVYLCGCKRTGTRPFCDGTHDTL